MTMMRVCSIALACAAGALGFGLAVHTALNLIALADGQSAFGLATAVLKSAPAGAAPAPASFALASASSGAPEFSPIKVKTVAIAYRDGVEVTEPPAAPVKVARVPLPRPRPLTAPEHVTSIAR